MSRSPTEGFVRSKFAEYYQEHSDNVRPPSQLRRREFGFIPFGERMMIRHRGFTTAEDLVEMIRGLVPAHAYYSSALYERPEEEMDKKGWRGADLIFDIDADHLPTKCKIEHDYWVCERCGHSGRGVKPDRCPRCGGAKFQEETWLCENCLDAAKNETLRLVDFLIDDFGFDSSEIEVCFSGHRGYHVHVEQEDIIHLDQSARREIVDYVSGIGISLERHGFTSVIPGLRAPGWRGRLSKSLYGLLNAPSSEVAAEGRRARALKRLLKHREELLQSFESNEPLRSPRGIGKKTWDALVDILIQGEISRVDSVVTTDIHRLTRMVGTLHGKTGLRVVQVPANALEAFDPLKEAVAFERGTVRVRILDVAKFRIGGAEYGPFKDRVSELPTAAAMLLLCKKVASLA